MLYRKPQVVVLGSPQELILGGKGNCVIEDHADPKTFTTGGAYESDE
jgi:hypothetical protein